MRVIVFGADAPTAAFSSARRLLWPCRSLPLRGHPPNCLEVVGGDVLDQPLLTPSFTAATP